MMEGKRVVWIGGAACSGDGAMAYLNVAREGQEEAFTAVVSVRITVCSYAVLYLLNQTVIFYKAIFLYLMYECSLVIKNELLSSRIGVSGTV